MTRPISTGMLPTIEKDDVRLSARLLLQPWLWKEGEAIGRLEKWFREYFKVSYAVSFNSGRSALHAILTSLGIGPGDEVLLQAFTCVVVPNAIIRVGAVPIYVDTKPKEFAMDPKNLSTKIRRKTKAIIIQHTFGISDEVEEIKAIARQHRLFLIEDCAHSLGGTYQGERLGTFGDAAFFSFGRDKVVSSVFGGMAITNNQRVGEALKKFQSDLPYPSHGWIIKQLIHPLCLSSALPLYKIGIGKALVALLRSTNLLSLPLSSEEKKGIQPLDYPKKLPNAQAVLALHQLHKLTRFTHRRKEITSLYRKFISSNCLCHPAVSDNGLIRYPLLVDKPEELAVFAKNLFILLGRWYSNVVDPLGTDLASVYYRKGTCPNAEYVAKKVINLPTAPILSDGEIKTVIEAVDKFYAYCR